MARWKPPTTANGKRVRLLIPLSNPPPGPIQGIHVLSQIRNQSGAGAASHLGFARARNKSRRGGAAAVWSSWLPWRICWLPHLLNAGPLMDHVFDTQQLALAPALESSIREHGGWLWCLDPGPCHHHDCGNIFLSCHPSFPLHSLFVFILSFISILSFSSSRSSIIAFVFFFLFGEKSTGKYNHSAVSFFS